MTLTAMATTTAWAGEGWNRWGGPTGDFKVSVDGLAKKWPEGGPKRLWVRDLGDGSSSILCEDGRLYTMYWLPVAPGPSDEGATGQTGSTQDEAKGDATANVDPEQDARRRGHEVVVALDAATGKTIWEYKYPASWSGDMDNIFFPPTGGRRIAKN